MQVEAERAAAVARFAATPSSPQTAAPIHQAEKASLPRGAVTLREGRDTATESRATNEGKGAPFDA